MPDKFSLIKNDILGKDYSLSIAYVSEKKSQEINKKYRKKDKPTNVLSFSLRKNEGEIILCPTLIKKESKDKNKNFGKNYEQLLVFLVIHGMLHLKGMTHGSTMEEAEKKYCRKYDKEYLSRNRRGLLHDQSSGGRIHQGTKRGKKS